FAVALYDAAPDLREHSLGTPTTAPPSHQRDDAEIAREAAAVLDLHERADSIKARVGVDAADRTDVSGDELRGLLARPRNHDDVRRQARERRSGEARAATRDVDASVRPCGTRGLLARLRDRLVRDAARVD